MPHLAALAVVLACQEHLQAQRRLATSQITAPARAAELIDRLRCSGLILTYGPQQRTLRTDTEDAIAITVGRSR